MELSIQLLQAISIDELIAVETALTNKQDLINKKLTEIFGNEIKYEEHPLNLNNISEQLGLNADLNSTFKKLGKFRDTIDPEIKKTVLASAIAGASKRTHYLSYAASLTLMFLGGSMMFVGGGTAVISAFFGAATLPTVVGAVVGALGVIGGIGLAAAGAAVYATGAGSAGYTFFKPQARLERNIKAAQQEMLSARPQ